MTHGPGTGVEVIQDSRDHEPLARKHHRILVATQIRKIFFRRASPRGGEHAHGRDAAGYPSL
jgi:hypothetical protein